MPLGPGCQERRGCRATHGGCTRRTDAAGVVAAHRQPKTERRVRLKHHPRRQSTFSSLRRGPTCRWRTGPPPVACASASSARSPSGSDGGPARTTCRPLHDLTDAPSSPGREHSRASLGPTRSEDPPPSSHQFSAVLECAVSLHLTLPMESGGRGGPGTNPEQLSAAGDAACFDNELQ